MPSEHDAKALRIIAEVEKRLAKLEALIALSEHLKAEMARLIGECTVLQNSFDPKENVHESGNDQHRIN
jgi:hypothetical protein